MKRNLNFILIFFLLAPFSVSAFQSVHPDAFKSPVRRFFAKVWECKLSVDCYRGKLGAFTQLTSSDTLSAFPTMYNANQAITLETGTTSVASITTLSGLTTATALVSVGTLTTGALGSGFTPVVVARGGTGSTTLSQYQLLVGNGTGIVQTVNGFGSSGDFLKSNGNSVVPSWQAASTDLTGNYVWTGNHTFSLGATSTASSTFERLFTKYGTTTQSTTTYLTVSTIASTSDLIVSQNCTSCPGSYTGSSTAFSVTSGTVTYTGSIPGNARYGLATCRISESAGGGCGGGPAFFMIARSGLTSVTFYDIDNGYTATWSGNNFSVEETADGAANSVFDGTIYWYR